MITRQCKQCGKVFQIHAAWARKRAGAGQFCSRVCSDQGKKRRPVTMLSAVCQFCGERFEKRKNRANKLMFCSSSCRGKMRTKLVAELPASEKRQRHKRSCRNHSRPAAVRTALKNAVIRAGKCEDCGSTKALHGHHRKPYSKFPELAEEQSNIEVLCADCHRLRHPGMGLLKFWWVKRTGFTSVCRECGQQYYRQPRLKGKTSFCSRACALNALRKGVTQHGGYKAVGA